jgi:hypothetical protein
VNKKKQKDFGLLGAVAEPCHNAQEQTFFAAFFQKRSACV